jgi:hypothetical protein
MQLPQLILIGLIRNCLLAVSWVRQHCF